MNAGKENLDIYGFIFEAFSSVLDNFLTIDQLVALTLKTDQFLGAAMALLDEANTSKVSVYG